MMIDAGSPWFCAADTRILFSTPMVVHRVGTAGSRLCDGRFSETKIVLPCQEAYKRPLYSDKTQAIMKSYPGMEKGIPIYLMFNTHTSTK
jgi:hypothetical protein